jgi:hypothetical protein
LIEEPVVSTTAAYTTVSPPTLIEEPVAEMPAYHKERQVRDILDKISLYFQTKNEATNDFVATSYCQKTSTHGVRFQYYKVHPTDLTKYVECDPWGKGVVKACSVGRIWNQFHEMCTTPQFLADSRNQTAEFERNEKLENTFTGLNCNNSDYKCVNDGKCVQFEEGYKCECTAKFTGELCEYKIVKNSVFSEILTGKFNLTKFKNELSEASMDANTITSDEMTSMKSMLDEATHKEIMTYLGLFDKSHVRYDIVLNELIENILKDIYPDAYYMSEFNATSHKLVEIVRTIPSLISYEKYSNERYTEVFNKYQEVLDKVVTTFNETWSGINLDASEYTKIIGKVLNETGIMKEAFAAAATAKKVTEKDLTMKLESIYKKTTEQTMLFTLELTGLRGFFIKEIAKRPEIINMRLSELAVEYKEVKELVAIFDEVRRSSSEVVNSLFNFGFWYATDAFANGF